MDKDTQVTFAVIGILILFLAGLAYFLRESISMPIEKVIGGKATTTVKVTRTSVSTATTTTATTTQSTSTKSTTTMEVPEKINSAVITTSKGVIEVTFATNTPETVKNFAKLATSGFYNGTKFHRVISDFMIQGGDPLSKDDTKKESWGKGGPGYTFKDEIYEGSTFSQGVLAMANSGPSTNGSQFFIVTASAGTPWLSGKHTIFGHVTKGLDIALRIQDVQVDGASRPLQDVVVEKVEIK